MYENLCITCHGNEHIDGSLPTALKFHLENSEMGPTMEHVPTLTKGMVK